MGVGGLKSRGGGGHVNFHVASRGGGVAINFDFPAGGGGSCLYCSNKIIKKKSSLARILLINLLYLVRQADNCLSFYFCKCKSYSILVFLLL